MVSAVPEPRGLAAPTQAVARWLGSVTGSGEAFACAIRVRDGIVAGEGRVWRVRRSVVESGRTDGVCVLRHGAETVLKLRFTAAPTSRLGFVLFAAEEIGSGSRVEVLCRPDAARRMQLPG